MAIVRLDKIAGTHLQSVKLEENAKNGYFVKLGGLVEGEPQLREGAKVADPTEDQVVLHATPEVDPDPRKAGFKHFELEAGTAGRGYVLQSGDAFTLTADLFTAEPSVGDVVTPQADSFKLGEAVTGSKLQLKVLEETVLGYEADKAFYVEVM